MSAGEDLTKAQWRRRALVAEARVETLQKINASTYERLLEEAQNSTANRVLLDEIRTIVKETAR